MGGASKDFFFPHLFLSAVLSVVFVLLQCIAVVVFQGRCDDVNITPPSFLRRPWMAAPPPSPPFVGGAQQCILRRSGGPEREWKLRGKRGREGGRDGEGSEGEGSGHHLSRAKRYMDDEERRGSHASQRAAGAGGRLFKLLPGILAVLPNGLVARGSAALAASPSPSHGC